MEIIPVTFVTICIPTGMILIVESINNVEKKQDLYLAGICLLALGAIAMFWGIWQVYQRRKDEIQKNFEGKLMRDKELELLNEMLAELKDLSKNKGK